MARIAMLGAGGTVFPVRLVGDLRSFPALRDATFALMDIDLGRAGATAECARELAVHLGQQASEFDRDTVQ